jgi:hypothetical protein
MRLTAFATALTLILATLPSSSAQAQRVERAIPSGRGGLGGYADPYWGRQGNFICRRWCLEDRNPCDSVQSKEADGRCEGNQTFFGVLNCRIKGETRPECPTFSRSR